MSGSESESKTRTNMVDSSLTKTTTTFKSNEFEIHSKEKFSPALFQEILKRNHQFRHSPIGRRNKKQIDPSRSGHIVASSLNSLPLCIICHQNDAGYLFCPCTCPSMRNNVVHFHCLKQFVLNKKRLNCQKCNKKFIGIDPIYDYIQLSRAAEFAFFFYIFLECILIASFLTYVSPDYKLYFRSFFTMFISVILITFFIFFISSLFILHYNAHNRKLVDCFISNAGSVRYIN